MSTNARVSDVNTPAKVISNVRALATKNPRAMSFFKLNAERLRDAAVTNLDVIERKLEISRPEVVQFAKDLESTGACAYVIGRRGMKSRLEWKYSCVALGKSALGESVVLDKPAPGWPQEPPVDNFETKTDIETAPSENPPQAPPRSFPSREEVAQCILATKESLSRTLGFPANQIEVLIRA